MSTAAAGPAVGDPGARPVVASTPGERTVVTGRQREECPVTAVLRRVGDKWSPAVLRLLGERPHGYNELDRAIEGISRRVLTRTLRALEAEGYVRRAALGAPPARVEYSLTDQGASLRELLFVLGQWAIAHRPGPVLEAETTSD
ncbi:DNA-binding transcriptional regulator, HxlR family [Parafrankia irregularis]|uniref:DNA-binding transcriptional regulator, HxlR family n=1 Tax=Parafrankia irregularis TaxID=795642 RepID=A0A0S4QXP7_9ACTN|nr:MULTISPECIES: helix-turn-helix domain-containing protein [Parafrankia]MBE3205786.1 helix-turn-helix transcriptional regulator [Parafrankia sp. CH37]CUU59660.1 DNA-binding transcriptional regulator, HxlR family [Parafrankia irregularis]